MLLTPTIDIDRIRQTLAVRTPKLAAVSERGRAAVALILRSTGEDLEILFIERAHHPQDPWSGNIAFPGGRIDPGDDGARSAAERETLEEIGVALSATEYLGQLDDIVGAYLPVQVSCFVYLLSSETDFATDLNHEVSDLFFFPLSELRNPDRHRRTGVRWDQGIRQAASINLLGPGRPLLWGITYRLVCQFLDLIGTPLAPLR